eukprot:gb/GEZN01008649.1/.p1 GENE.gb/GEZN01008649.1/~~gb/GEZN01008649.1/.p1  ORF type:complete len:197 (+),score=19.70 gb/GEZN01008649.1/:1-591(+)
MALAMFFSGVNCCSTLYLRPYKESHSFKLMIFSLIAQFITLFGGLLILAQFYVKDAYDVAVYDWIMVLFNAFVFVEPFFSIFYFILCPNLRNLIKRLKSPESVNVESDKSGANDRTDGAAVPDQDHATATAVEIELASLHDNLISSDGKVEEHVNQAETEDLPKLGVILPLSTHHPMMTPPLLVREGDTGIENESG